MVRTAFSTDGERPMPSMGRLALPNDLHHVVQEKKAVLMKWSFAMQGSAVDTGHTQ
jgi:hypothetical protein